MKDELSKHLEALERYVAFMRPVMQRMAATEFDPRSRPIDTLNLVCRAALIRQFEGLESVLLLLRNDHGHVASILVRPAAEELIWVRYLRKIKPADAVSYLLLTTNLSMAKAARTQGEVVGLEQMKDWGLEDVFAIAAPTEQAMKSVLLRLAKRLKWRKKFEPSLEQLAEETNSQIYYKLIYQASSRTVHFSPPELLRRGWGNEGQHPKVTISSKHFNEYWSLFALSWTFDIFVHLCADLHEWFPDDLGLEGEEYLELIKEVAVPRMPIITAAELNIRQGKKGES